MVSALHSFHVHLSAEEFPHEMLVCGPFENLLLVTDGVVTSDSLDVVPGRSGRLNFFCEPMAAGKGGDENMAATVLIRVIHDCICSAFLQTEPSRNRRFISFF